MSAQYKIVPAAFQKLLLKWFDTQGRKDLPWQQNKTAYRIWVSEVMLQQTQVKTVIDYFHRFMKRFPNVKSLSTASIDEVLHLWTGLGYYTRARNLHRTAKIIAHDYAGQFPPDVLELQKLPGLGRSTSGAIVAIAFQKKSAILDGNVKRVLTRLYGITAWPGEKKVTDILWKIAEELTPTRRVDDYTQAIMDLGATLCTRGMPHCELCPFTLHCKAFQLGIQKKIPQPKPRKILPVRETKLLLLQNKNHVLLQKRSASGIWGGLWSLPEAEATASEDEISALCKQRFHLDTRQIVYGELFRHTFSHFHLDILPVYISIQKIPFKIMDSEQQIWYNLQDSQAIGLPAPVAKLLRALTCPV